MEVENYIYKDNLLYPTYPLFVSLPHYFPSVSDRWFGEGRDGASISFQNRQEFLPTVLSPT